MKSIILSAENADHAVAEQIAEIINKKPTAVIAFSGGRTTQSLLRLLAEMSSDGSVSFSEAYFFCVADYVTADQGDSRSARNVITELFISASDISRKRCYFPTAENAGEYDSLIKACGGIDICVLGLGCNAHIGYNEPAVPFDSCTRVRKLTQATKRQNAVLFGCEENVPEYGVTMGISTIMCARKIIVLARGNEKADAVYKMMYARTDSVVPAAFLQLHTDVDVYTDMEASALL